MLQNVSQIDLADVRHNETSTKLRVLHVLKTNNGISYGAVGYIDSNVIFDVVLSPLLKIASFAASEIQDPLAIPAVFLNQVELDPIIQLAEMKCGGLISLLDCLVFLVVVINYAVVLYHL